MSEYRLMLSEVLEGRMDALDAFINLRKHLKELENVLVELQPLAITEAEKYGAKSFEAFGAKIELRNGASRWNFQGSAYESAKARLEYVQNIAKAGGGADPNTGEVIDAATKVEGKSTIAITLNK